MHRLTACFAQLKAQKRKALIPFLTAGDPTSHLTVPLMHTLVAAGADILELGIPFSDPMADGPVIQRANERALKTGIQLQQVLDMVETFRTQDKTTPIVLMGYLNPIEKMGYEMFAETANHCGIDGVLVVDLPPEETMELGSVLKQKALAQVFLLAPNSTPDRIEHICAQAAGYVYYVSLKGVTGSTHLDVTTIADKVAEIRQHTVLPIGVGFGIHDAKTAAAVAKISDAIIVGSALVQRIETFSEDKLLNEITLFIKTLREAIDTH